MFWPLFSFSDNFCDTCIMNHFDKSSPTLTLPPRSTGHFKANFPPSLACLLSKSTIVLWEIYSIDIAHWEHQNYQEAISHSAVAELFSENVQNYQIGEDLFFFFYTRISVTFTLKFLWKRHRADCVVFEEKWWREVCPHDYCWNQATEQRESEKWEKEGSWGYWVNPDKEPKVWDEPSEEKWRGGRVSTQRSSTEGVMSRTFRKTRHNHGIFIFSAVHWFGDRIIRQKENRLRDFTSFCTQSKHLLH